MKYLIWLIPLLASCSFHIEVKEQSSFTMFGDPGYETGELTEAVGDEVEDVIDAIDPLAALGEPKND